MTQEIPLSADMRHLELLVTKFSRVRVGQDGSVEINTYDLPESSTPPPSDGARVVQDALGVIEIADAELPREVEIQAKPELQFPDVVWLVEYVTDDSDYGPLLVGVFTRREKAIHSIKERHPEAESWELVENFELEQQGKEYFLKATFNEMPGQMIKYTREWILTRVRLDAAE